RGPRSRTGCPDHARMGARGRRDGGLRYGRLRRRGGPAPLGPGGDRRYRAPARRAGCRRVAPGRNRHAGRTERAHRQLLGACMTLIERTFREKIVLVGVTVPPEREEETERHLDELALLVDTAGADEAARVLQRRERPDPATYVGRGKAQELR